MRHLLLLSITVSLTCLSTACKTDTTHERARPTPVQEVAEPAHVTRSETASSTPARLTTPQSQPEELGQVAWLRDFEQAQAESTRTGKPMFVLFTEVPGCYTVRGFADEVLTHPLLVEAIETEFVPVAIYNNIDGEDRRVLESFGEPTWNNPVVRLMDAERGALAPRFSGPYEVAGLLPSMLAALDVAGRDVPAYLNDLASEERARAQGTEEAVFSMYCFWSGEAKLGGMSGVVASRTGFAQGKEVVEVSFDPSRTSSSKLAEAFGSEPLEEGVRVRGSHKDDKYQLQHSSWRHVPMTPQQASRVNAALGRGQSPARFLSARQRTLHAHIEASPEREWPDVSREPDIRSAWSQVVRLHATP